MKPSRIVKSAWRKAGKPGSLKSFACTLNQLSVDTWQDNKRKQNKRRQAVGFSDVYTRAGIRRSL